MRPSIPRASNRLDHIDTRLGVVPRRSAAAATESPSIRSKTISARSRSRTAIFEDRARRRNSVNASLSANNRLIGRAIPTTLAANQLR